MARSTNAQSYSNFIGLDASSDPRTVARNRLAYSVNMWRDYESEQGAAIETFPGFRRVAHSLGKDSAGGEIGAVHGLYHFRSRKGVDYVVVHAGAKIYAFEESALAAGNYKEIAERGAILADTISDSDSTGFVFNNGLYILDGSKYFVVTEDGGNPTAIKAREVDPYVPTTFYNGNVLEQRNMLSVFARQVENGTGEDIPADVNVRPNVAKIDWTDMVNFVGGVNNVYGYVDGYKSFGGIIEEIKPPNIIKWEVPNASNFVMIANAKRFIAYHEETFSVRNLGNNNDIHLAYILQNGGVFEVKDNVEQHNYGGFVIESNTFENCENLKKVYLHVNRGKFEIKADAFKNCKSLTDIYFYSPDPEDPGYDRYNFEDGAIPDGVTLHKFNTEPPEYIKALGKYNLGEPEYPIYIPDMFTKKYVLYEPVKTVMNIKFDNADDVFPCFFFRNRETLSGETVELVKYACFIPTDVEGKRITFDVEIYPNHFAKVENMTSFQEDDIGYKENADKAIMGCTKSAVYDGRIFLTGNSELPNTVFYSQRNLTGANDPTYFGVYNYFNDGQGNTPNVDVLSTSSMLMVIKGNTVQDGSVYYHVAATNTDEKTKNLLPKIYPSTQGAAGLGSAGDTSPSQLSCNFLDDPIFISKRGVESVGKEAVNLERNIQHRSSNIDRLFIREDLAHASLAEWKKYLVICCDGHMYLADSRYMIQHSDGSLQYEWYYLEGVGTYEGYDPRWEYLGGAYPYVDDNYTLDEYIVSGERIGDAYKLRADGTSLTGDAEIMHVLASAPDGSNDVDLYFVIEDGERYIVVANSEEKRGVGQFFGATRIVAVGDRLIFGTDNGDICIINTDMRGVSVDGRAVDYDRIDRSFYSFNGVPYLSGCATRLDDCDQKFFKKNTVCGTTTARFKMMPGSHCKAMVSTNGRDWEKLGEAGSSRFDFADIDFANMSFAENENNVVVFPEISRGWVNKQYYFYSDQFEAPFGLYELSYLWYASGKIRY